MANGCGPCGLNTTLDLKIQGAQFSVAAIDPSELSLFQVQLDELFTAPWSIERQLIKARQPIIENIIGIAKNEFKGKGFGGFNAHGGEFGVSPIRPGQVGMAGTSAGEGDNTWIWAANTASPATSTGFTNWIHSPTTATTAFAVPMDPGELVYPFYCVEENPSPILQTVKYDLGRSDILFLDVSAGRVRDSKAPDVSYYMLPSTIWKPATNVLLAIQTKKAGYLDLRLGGFVFAEAEFLDATTYNTSTNTVAAVKTVST